VRTSGDGNLYQECRAPGRLAGNDQCPVCGATLNAAGIPDDPQARPPEPGDLSVCIRCAWVLMFDAELRLVEAPRALLDSLSPEPRRTPRQRTNLGSFYGVRKCPRQRASGRMGKSVLVPDA
jgi:hypothetical protein